MTKTDYEKWDKDRRHIFPNALHERWQSWNGGNRVAGFDDIEHWIYDEDDSHYQKLPWCTKCGSMSDEECHCYVTVEDKQ